MSKNENENAEMDYFIWEKYCQTLIALKNKTLETGKKAKSDSKKHQIIRIKKWHDLNEI